MSDSDNFKKHILKLDKWVAYAMVFLCVIFLVYYFSTNWKDIKNIRLNSEDSISKVNQRNALEHQAYASAEAGELDEALRLYKQAIHPAYITYEYQKGTAMGAMLEIYKWEKKYDEALKVIEWYLRDKPLEKPLEWKREVIALKQFAANGDSKAVYEHIRILKTQYKDSIPPFGYNMYSSIVISDILRLYDSIKDYDAGTKFIDEIIDWSYMRKDSEFKNVPRPQSAAECLQKGNWHDPDVRHRDPEWRAYKFLYQYLTVREGFEKDKADGGPDCKGQKYCIGSATKAIIQSDYFPW